MKRSFFENAALVLAMAAALRLLFDWTADPDLWGHLFFGKLALKGDLVRIDRFSFTAEGLPFINHEWLSEMIFALSQEALGNFGPPIIKVSVAIFALILLWQAITVESLALKAIIFAVLVTIVTPGFSMRPQIFSYLFILILGKFCSKKLNAIHLFLLFGLWANLHGAFLFGLGILSANLIFKNELSKVTRFKLILSAAIGTIVNPYGVKLWGYLLTELTNPLSSQYLAEWAPFNFQEREIPFFILLTFLIIGSILLIKKIKLAELAVLFASGTLGLLSIRHTPLLALSNVALLSRIFGIFPQSFSISQPVKNFVAALLSFTAIFIVIKIPFSKGIQMGEDPYPTAFVEYLKSNPICKRVWVPLHWGGMTLAELSPEVKVSIDGRWATLYPRAVMQENLDFEFSETPKVWKDILGKWQADCAFIELSHPFFQAMAQDQEWYYVLRNQIGGLLIKK